jgi:Cu+-exporting ATPase
VIAAAGHAEDAVLRVAAALEQGSEHPLADAVVERARSRRMPVGSVDGFEARVGRGVVGVLDGVPVSRWRRGISG